MGLIVPGWLSTDRENKLVNCKAQVFSLVLSTVYIIITMFNVQCFYLLYGNTTMSAVLYFYGINCVWYDMNRKLINCK